jgi:hypothetical protein
MQKLRLALILMIIVVATASYFKERGRPAAPATPETAPSPLTVPLASPTPGASPTASPTPVAAHPRTLPTETQSLVRSCLAKDPSLPRVAVTDSTTLEDVLRDLSPAPSSAQLNVHVVRPDGREERLLVQPTEGAHRAYRLGSDDIRIFDVDSEGLPILRDVPPALRRDTLTHTVNAFIGNDAVTFRERRAQYKFEGGIASAVETNGALNELQLTFGHTTLGCAWQNQNLNCACL